MNGRAGLPRRREGAPRRSRPRRSRGVEDRLAERGTERQAAVDRDRPVADRLTPALDRREIGDHRAGPDEERGLADAAQHADREQEPRFDDEHVQHSRQRHDQRRADDTRIRRPNRSPSRPANGRRRTAPTANAPTAMPTRASSPPRLVLDVQRQDREQHPERRGSTAPPAEVTSTNCRRQEPLRAARASAMLRCSARRWRRANASASANDARSAIMRRYCMTRRGCENAEHAARCGLGDRRARRTAGRRARRARPPCGRRPAEAARALDLHVVLVGPDERAPARTACARRVAVEQALRRRTRPAPPRSSSARCA